MLTIRSEQLQAFETAATNRFEGMMMLHAAQYFPNHYGVLGPEQVAAVVRLGIARAKSHGVCAQGDVCRYINLMWMFGSHFERDPLLPWADAMLTGASLYSPAMRVDQVASHGMRYFAQIAGEGHFLLNRAMLRLRHALPAMLAVPIVGDVHEHVLGLLAGIFPAKHSSIQTSLWRDFLDLATAKAAHYGFASPAGTVMIASIMFMAGSGFDDDPQHAWASGILQDAASGDEAARLERLCRHAQAHLALWLARSD